MDVLHKMRLWFAFMGIFANSWADLHGTLPFTISQFFVILLFILCFADLLLQKKIILNIWYIILFSTIFISSFIVNTEYIDGANIKMYVGFVVYALAYYWFIKLEQTNIRKILDDYIIVCVLFSIIAFIQQIGHFLNLSVLWDLSYLGITINNFAYSGPFIRSYALAAEPTHFATFLAPSFYFIIRNAIRADSEYIYISKFKSFIIFFGLITSFSLMGYAYFIIILFYVFINQKGELFKKYFVLIVFVGFAILSFFYIPNIRYKILSLFVSKIEMNSTTNLSAFAVIGNYYVAKEAFVRNPYFGTGINTHRFSYDKFIKKIFPGTEIKINNVGDSSLYTRIPSEFGMAGIIITLLLLYLFKIKKKDDINKYKILNDLSFIFLIVSTLRNGQYLDGNIWMFFAIYVFSFNLYHTNLINDAK